MSPQPKPCMDCGERAKQLPRRLCAWCQLKRQPMHAQAEAAKARLAMVPEELRVKRSQKVVRDDTPPNLAFCAGCQTFCPSWYFAKNATQCRPCSSMKTHEAMVKKTYGIDGDEYARILEVQGGLCAICRQGFKTVRGAVDHDHKSNAVRGILDARCNHEALGALHDEPRAAWNAYLYLIHPPALLKDETWEEFLARHPMPSIEQVELKEEKPPAPTPARATFGKPSETLVADRRGGKAKPKPEPVSWEPIQVSTPPVVDHSACYVCKQRGDLLCAPF